MAEQKLESVCARRGIESVKAVSFGSAIFLIPLFLRFAPSWAESFYPVCFLSKITGLYCPGCGTMRAFESMAKFDFSSAFLYNPFLFLIVIPLSLYLCVIYTLRAVSGRQIPSLLSSHKSALPILVIIICVWIFRNIFPLKLADVIN